MINEQQPNDRAAMETEISIAFLKAWTAVGSEDEPKLSVSRVLAELARQRDRCSAWIPVCERLPDEGDRYLVMWEFSGVGPFPAVTEFFPESDGPEGWEPIAGVHESAEVIAWMPITPYTPEQSSPPTA